MREILQSPKARLQEMNQRDNSLGPDRLPPEQRGPILQAHLEERERILKEVIARLQGEFSNEDFKKLDAYVYETSTEGAYAMEGRREQKESVPHPQPAASSESGRRKNPSSSNPDSVAP